MNKIECVSPLPGGGGGGGGDEAFSRYGESNTWPRVIDDAKTHRNFGAAI